MLKTTNDLILQEVFRREAMVTIGQLYNYAIPVVFGFIGWFMREMWTAMQVLKADLSKLREDLPHEYVQKDDYKSDIGRVQDTLDKIYDKLQTKADK